jgi:predicted membrane-bound mannosyltransferase
MSSRWTVRWKPLPGWVEVACLLLITAVAVGFRLYQIGEVPPGPHYDEASATFDALDVLAGRHTVFSLRPYGREMLFAYVAAPLVALLGPGRLAIRLPTAILGVSSSLLLAPGPQSSQLPGQLCTVSRSPLFCFPVAGHTD